MLTNHTGSGILHSPRTKHISFPETCARYFKIVIDNHDNQPLNYGEVKFGGFEHRLIGRFTKKGNYYFCYGKENDRAPSYDIVRLK